VKNEQDFDNVELMETIQAILYVLILRIRQERTNKDILSSQDSKNLVFHQKLQRN